jgi:hypothetical protein
VHRITPRMKVYVLDFFASKAVSKTNNIFFIEIQYFP